MMRNHLHSRLTALVLLTSFSIPLPVHASDTGSWLLDLSSADVSFSVRVLGLFEISGAFERVHGDLVFNESCMASGIRFSIDSASVTTRDTGIAELLRGPTLLNTENFPVISFSSSRIVLDDSGSGSITGQLALNGINREVRFKLDSNGRARLASPAAATQYQATARISRTEFGITALPIAVSDKINITVVVEARPENIRLADASRGESI